jgi:hypothetical protein
MNNKLQLNKKWAQTLTKVFIPKGRTCTKENYITKSLDQLVLGRDKL